MFVYAALVALTVVGFRMVPPGFVPTQDKAYLVSFAQLPEGATLDRTEAVIRKMSDIALKEPGVLEAHQRIVRAGDTRTLVQATTRWCWPAAARAAAPALPDGLLAAIGPLLAA